MTLSIDKFSFGLERTLFSDGEYRVRYTTGRGDYYEALIGKDHRLVEEVLGNDNVPRTALLKLREIIKTTGLHYSIHDTLKK